MFRSLAKRAAWLAGLIAGCTALPASAQDRIGLIEITNGSDTEKRVCVYKDQRINLKAEECFDLPSERTTIWARGENRKAERFKVKVFEKRKLLPKYLYSRDRMPGDTVSITVRDQNLSARAYRAPAKPKPSYRVKFCNEGQTGKVWLAIGFSGGQSSGPKAYSEGYWGIAPKECITINYSELLMKVGGGYPLDPPKMMYRAYTVGDNAAVWSGAAEREDPVLCVNTKRKYAINQWDRNAGPNGGFTKCDGPDQAMQRFRWTPTLGPEVQIGRVNF
ncbi:hypothetical protein [Erythrobacter crassostreae]|uniref:Uncharacterized protein n=1 Tax=Erythrobacter crassostreae TaxID=2828328 RepID=A0A9X1F4I7_9SPHN|nr:hypothetical protein [Erythrobacter crassostrea]MBV7260097.1 hypothetical protein [Erythrobacter crassostrea]